MSFYVVVRRHEKEVRYLGAEERDKKDFVDLSPEEKKGSWGPQLNYEPHGGKALYLASRRSQKGLKKPGGGECRTEVKLEEIFFLSLCRWKRDEGAPRGNRLHRRGKGLGRKREIGGGGERLGNPRVDAFFSLH